MATWQGMGINDPKLRELFTRSSLLQSDWYQKRLKTKQNRDAALWQRHLAALEAFQSTAGPAWPSQQVDVEGLLNATHEQLARVSAPEYLKELVGTIGADPFEIQVSGS